MKVLSRYAETVRPPGLRTALLAGLGARLSISMTGLGLLLLVRRAGGSYGAAGLVSACCTVACALAVPWLARTADRRGPAPVLRLAGVLNPLGFLAVILLTSFHAPILAVAAGAVLVGATVPPIASVMRALWGVALPPALVPVAYSLESVLVEVNFVAGPMLVAALSAVGTPTAAVVVAAVAACTGSIVLSGLPVVRAVAPHPARPTHLAGPLVSPVVRACLLCVVFVGSTFGATEVGVLAFVEQHHHSRAVAGVVLAVWSLGSAVGGLTYGGLRLRADAARQLPILVAIAGVAAGLPLLAPGVTLLGLLLFLTGCTIAPWNTANSVVVGRWAPPGTATEAFAWVSSLITGGIAGGTALAGVLADSHGATGAFALAACGGLCAALAALFATRALGAHETDRSPVAS